MAELKPFLKAKKKSVKELIEFCRRGPPGARVTDVDIIWENYTGEFRNFEVRYGYRF